MAGINLKEVLQRIQETLQNDYTLKEKISSFHIGESGDDADKETFADSYPAVIISTPSNPFITHESYGSSSNSDYIHIVRLHIRVVTSMAGSDAEQSKLDVFDLVNDVTRILDANPQLKNTDNTDPKFSRSFVADIIEDESRRGSFSQAVTIVIQGTIGNYYSISLGVNRVGNTPLYDESLQNIPVFNITGPDGINFSEDTPNGTRILTENNKNGSLYAEIEFTDTIRDKLDTIFNADEDIRLQIREGSLLKAIDAYPVSIERVIEYDRIRRRVLYFELV